MTLDEEYVSFRNAVIIALFKIFYTQVFGYYSGLVYVNTGSLWPAIALHAQCNFFGFPSFGNLFSSDFRRSERIFVSILYLIGVCFIFRYIDFFTKPSQEE